MRWVIPWLLAGCTTVVVRTLPSDAPAATLAEATPLDVGDPACPGEGVRVRTGRDDGSGGGQAGDGVLQDGEVLDDVILCDVPAPPEPPGPRQDPVGPLGERVISLQGGDGQSGRGGRGGGAFLQRQGGGRDGHIGLYATDPGAAPATLPAQRLDLGAYPVTVDADLVLPLVDDPAAAGLQRGDLYLRPGSAVLNRNQLPPPTGLHVLAGVQLTVPENLPGRAALQVQGPLLLEGALTSVARGAAHLPLTVTVRALDARPGSLIDLSGAPGGDGEPGGAGGTLTLSVSATTPGVNPLTSMTLLGGTLDLQGGLGQPAGAGGRLVVQGSRGMWVAGVVDARGGEAVGPGAPGQGGSVDLRSEEGAAWLIGDVLLDAGSSQGAPAPGGSLTVFAQSASQRGTVSTRGSSAPTCSATCRGGDGGDVTFDLSGSRLEVRGQLDLRGGDALGSRGVGGTGGTLTMSHVQPLPALIAGPRSLVLAGDVVLDGGDGGQDGGDAGQLQVNLNASLDPTAEILGLGIARLAMNGGAAGRGDGGPGGTLLLGQTTDRGATADLVLSTEVDVSGGDSGEGEGGGGGEIGVEGQIAQVTDASQGRVVVRGRLDLQGGEGTTASGSGGALRLRGVGGVFVDADVVGDAGPTASPDGSGGDAGARDRPAIELSALAGPVSLQGSLSSVGASGRGGGRGGSVFLQGTSVLVDAAVDLRGGDGLTEPAGAGGWFVVESSAGDVLLDPTTVLRDGGEGISGTAPAGRVVVDGVPVVAGAAP